MSYTNPRGHVIAVTGATGFVGTWIVRELLERGARVRALVRDPASARERLGPAVELGELRLEHRAAEVDLAGCLGIVHAAAHKPAGSGVEELVRCTTANAQATHALATAAAAAGLESFVYLSAANAYARRESPATEMDALYPDHRACFYLASKAYGEVLASHVGKTTPLRVVLLRASSVYGPGMGAAGLFPTLAKRLRAREPVSLHDGGRARADLVFVGDVSRAVWESLAREVRGPINVASGQWLSALEIAETAAELVGAPRDLLKVEAPGATDPAHFSSVDPALARRVLGLDPTPFREGMRRYLESDG